jgi:hypothetical protein
MSANGTDLNITKPWMAIEIQWIIGAALLLATIVSAYMALSVDRGDGRLPVTVAGVTYDEARLIDLVPGNAPGAQAFPALALRTPGGETEHYLLEADGRWIQVSTGRTILDWDQRRLQSVHDRLRLERLNLVER